MKSNGERIDDAYNKLTNAISDMDKKYNQLKPGEVISDKDFKNLSDILKEVREVSEDKDILSEYLSDIDKDVPADAEPHVVNERRDNKTGLFAVTEDSPSTFKGDLDASYNISNDTILDILNEHFGEIEDLDKVSEIITRRANGEIFDIYKELPQSMKNIVDAEAVKYPDYRTVRKMIADMLVNQLADEVKKNAGMDMDDFMRDIKKDIMSFSDELSRDTAKLSIDMMADNLESVNLAISKATEENDQEKLKRFTDIKQGMLDADNLEKFKEFCKRVKIKKFDIEKPSKWYRNFLMKYENHKYNIYDIFDCEAILSRHFDDDSRRNIALLITFCKYCMNFSPDNIYEHTFMYYFIKNIVILDRLKPRGMFLDIDNDKEIYYHIYDNIKECMNLIKLPNN